MPGFAFVAPILPGKEQLDAETFEQFAVGDEHDAYVAAQSHYRTRRDRCGRAGGGSCGDRSAATPARERVGRQRHTVLTPRRDIPERWPHTRPLSRPPQSSGLLHPPWTMSGHDRSS